jgi:ribosomal protein S18 acetylase RimI-like enzyme
MVEAAPEPPAHDQELSERLDNPVWHAIRGPQATLAEGVGGAARYRHEVCVFAAIDGTAETSWDDLARLVGPGGAAVLFRAAIDVPDGWRKEMVVPSVQLWWRRATPPEGAPDAEELGATDVDDMLALVAATQPGPFERDTRLMGTYLGVRDRGQLVAMAGERMHLDGATEISAVCTAADHRGQGLASRLVGELIARMHRRGDLPFLHAATTNATAIAVYRQLGFEVRADAEAALVWSPVSD